MKMQLDQIILDLSKSAMPQETCENKRNLYSNNMGLLVLLVLALFLITSHEIWPTVIFPVLLITNSPPIISKVMKRSKK